MTHADSSFLVDLMREAARGAKGPARRFLDGLGDEPLFVSVHAICELLAGVELARSAATERRKVEQLLAEVGVVYPQEGFPEVYARLFRSLSASGTPIPTMDLLIATACVAAGARVVTRNAKHFSRVPGLDVDTY